MNIDGTSGRPEANATKVAARRIALWDTPTGSMSGAYHLVDENGDAFDVAIPKFGLLSPLN